MPFADALHGGKGKREAGADPARSRHCDKGVRVRVLCAPATGALLREGDAGRRSFSQETCLLLVRGPEPQITRNWLYQKALKKSEVFLSCHPQDRRASSFIFLSCTLCLVQTAIYPAGKDKNNEKDRNQKAGRSCYGSGSVRRRAHRLRRCCFQHCIQHQRMVMSQDHRSPGIDIIYVFIAIYIKNFTTYSSLYKTCLLYTSPSPRD